MWPKLGNFACFAVRLIFQFFFFCWTEFILFWLFCLSNGLSRTLKKGRLLDQARILVNCVPFQKGTSLKGKNLLPDGANSFLYEQFLIVWKITFITFSDLPWMLLFISRMCVTCIIGAIIRQCYHWIFRYAGLWWSHLLRISCFLLSLYLHAFNRNVDWLQSLKHFFHQVSFHILVASLTLMALF